MIFYKRFLGFWVAEYLTEFVLVMGSFVVLAYLQTRPLSQLLLFASFVQFIALIVLFGFAHFYHKKHPQTDPRSWVQIALLWILVSFCANLLTVGPVMGVPISSLWTMKSIAYLFLRFVCLLLAGYLVYFRSTKEQTTSVTEPKVDFISDLRM